MKKNNKKGLKIMLFVIGGILLLLFASVAGGISLMKHEYGDRAEVMQAKAADAKKALVVYQPSVTSASSDVAHAIAKGLNDAGFEVLLNTPGKHLSTDVSRYSVIVFGSPNYGGSPGEALLIYINQIEELSGKRIFLFSTSGRAEGTLEFEKMEASLRGSKPSGTLKLAVGDIQRDMASAYQFGADAAKAE